MNGLLFLIIGPSGVGKSTLIHELLNSLPLSFLLSFTSRPIRENEKSGDSYFFISKNDFKKKIKNKDFIEWKIIHDHYYGIEKNYIIKELSLGKNLITDLEVLGAMDLIEYFPKQCISIFINTQSKEELIKRIKKRGFIEKNTIERRLKRIDFELLYKNHFNYLVYNTNLNQAKKELEKIINFESSFKQERLKNNNTIIHYVIHIIMINFKDKILLEKQKFMKSNWQILSSHVLKNECPKDTLFRKLSSVFIKISNQLKDKIDKMKIILEENIDLKNHKHYIMTFKLKENINTTIKNDDNYEFQWFSYQEAKKYIHQQNYLKIINDY